MRTIRSKFIVLNIASLLICITVIGSVAFWFLSELLTDTSAEIMNLTCREQAKALDQELMGIQSSVDNVATLVNYNLESFDVFSDETKRNEFIAVNEELTYSIAKSTYGVSTFYLRIDPELSGGQDGFFYTKTEKQSDLHSFPLTDISDFDPSDTEHVGWYYQPKAAGKPIWMEPYYNQNIGVYMISYIVPLYKDGRFWGVVGMDVDFDLIINEVRKINPYKTGYAFLTSDTGKIYYHPRFEEGTELADNIPPLADFTQNFRKSAYTDPDDCYLFEENGVDKQLAYCGLHNGMYLMISAELREINSSRDPLISIIILTILIGSIVSAMFVMFISRKITRPLVKLTAAADQIARGNLDVDLPEAGEDEVGILTKSFALTVNSLKEYIAGMNTKAYRDTLTHVRNRAAFEETMAELSNQMKQGSRHFALLMLDLNDLKEINDNYGHDRGNDYLVNSCRMICHVFRHSPVFRIGGDEFIAILQNEDLENYETLLAEFEKRMAATKKESDPWKVISVAKGIAFCEDEDETPDSVFKRADENMYEDKHRMKKG